MTVGIKRLALFLALVGLASAAPALPKNRGLMKAAPKNARPALPKASVAAAYVRGGGATNTLDGVWTVAGGAMVHLVFGTLYCWGNFQAYAPASLRNYKGPVDILTIM